MELLINDEVVDACGFGGKCLVLIESARSVLRELTEESTYDERMSARNRILANGAGTLAYQFFGSINEGPTITVDYAKTWLKDEMAEIVIAHRNNIRAYALELVK